MRGTNVIYDRKVIVMKTDSIDYNLICFTLHETSDTHKVVI